MYFIVKSQHMLILAPHTHTHKSMVGTWKHYEKLLVINQGRHM